MRMNYSSSGQKPEGVTKHFLILGEQSEELEDPGGWVRAQMASDMSGAALEGGKGDKGVVSWGKKTRQSI